MALTGREWVKGAALRAPMASWLSRSLANADALRVLSVSVPIVVFVAHSSLFWGWIVDDAGISFAYARNLSEGHGLVSQPGFEPVEGYSNPLWVVLLAPLMALRLFDPVITPKLLSLALVGASFVLIYQALAIAVAPRAGRWRAVALGLPLLLLSLNSSFVVWTTSGLENPLFVLELSLMLLLAMRAVCGDEMTWALATALGATAAAAALTRPDAVLLAFAYPVLVLVGGLSAQRLRHLAVYVLTLVAPMAAFLALRLFYYGELYPNTYYAKGGVTLANLDLKLDDLRDSVLGFPVAEAQWLALAAAVAGLVAFRTPALRVAGVFLACSAASVLLLPPDWMRESRFFSGFEVAFYVVVALELVYLAQGIGRKPAELAQTAALAVAVLALVASTGWFIDRSMRFSDDPTVPMSEVESYFGDRFEGYAWLLGVDDPSLLTLDIGGLLYDSDLRVYDLVGLTDKTIARTLQHDRKAFHDYVLEDLRPTFIHTHGLYAVYAELDNDPRFRVLYRPICEQTDPWVDHVWHFYWYAGDYVRWDVAPDDSVVKQMEASCRKELPYPGN
jgi:hypothetical protein